MDKPIGIFDSGIGGLTVLKEIIRELPKEPFVYFGDTARVPYGGKSKETVSRFSIENSRFLERFGAKLIVVACHTASSLAMEVLKEEFSLPIIGVVEPGARKAAEISKNGRVGFIGTKATVASRTYETYLKAMDSKLNIFSAACPLFVSLAEEGWIEGDIPEGIVRQYLDPLISNKIDTLILGCTHYPLLEGLIRKVMGDDVMLVNPALETAKEAAEELSKLNIAAKGEDKTKWSKFFVTDEPEQFRSMGERFLGHPITVVARVTE